MYRQIKVPACWVDNHPDYYGDRRQNVANFELGLGPCGKEVTQLGLESMPEGIIVTQWCGEEIKQFFYPLHTLTGRIEATIL